MPQQTELPTHPSIHSPPLSILFIFIFLLFSSSPLHPLLSLTFSSPPALSPALSSAASSSSRTQCLSLNLAGKSSSFCVLELQRGFWVQQLSLVLLSQIHSWGIWLAFTCFSLVLLCFFFSSLHTLRSLQTGIADTL